MSQKWSDMKAPLLPSAVSIVLLCHCGGGSGFKSALSDLSVQTLANAVQAFTLVEHTPTGPDSLPAWLPTAPGKAAQLAIPAPGKCITTRQRQNPDGSTSVTLSFSCASKRDGSTLAGEVIYTFSPGTDQYRVDYRSLRMVRGSTSFTLNGVKTIQLHRSARHASISTPTPLTIAMVDLRKPELNQTFSYSCKLTSDYRNEGLHRLWGRFSLQAGTETVLGASIPPGDSLVWSSQSKCCHPTSGTVFFENSSKDSFARFGATCGKVDVEFGSKTQSVQLPACYR